MERDGVGVILQLLAESVCQARKPTHRHPHVQILSFDIASADMLRIGYTANGFHVAADAGSRTVSRLRLARGTEHLMKHRIVGIPAKRRFNSFEVWLVSVCRDLRCSNYARCAVRHKVHGPARAASPYKVRNDQFSIGVQPDPSPNVAPADLLFCGAYVPGFGSYVCPDFIALEAAHFDIADVFVVIFHARRPKIDQKFGDRIAGNSSHARCGTKAISFDQSGYNPNSLVLCERVHIDNYA